VSPRFHVWDRVANREIDNLFVCDSSVFPTSVGANPMQSIYTFAKLFVDTL
jgi:choline dehydrogenase-like flavoprotein